VVKFSLTYSRDLHLLASQKPPLAPQLYGYEEIPGGWKLAVMEHIEGAKYWDKTSTEQHCAALDKALKVMRENGLFHGDLRAPNVLISEKDRIFIIDFEYSGKENEVRFPYNIAAREYSMVKAKGLSVITHKLDEDKAALLKKREMEEQVFAKQPSSDASSEFRKQKEIEILEKEIEELKKANNARGKAEVSHFSLTSFFFFFIAISNVIVLGLFWL